MNFSLPLSSIPSPSKMAQKVRQRKRREEDQSVWLTLLNFNEYTHTHTHILACMHTFFSPVQTPLIATESQAGVTAAAVSTDNSTVTNIGLKCLMAGTPVKWKGSEQCEPGHWQKTKRGFAFSDFQPFFVPVKKGRVFRWRVKYLHCAAAVAGHAALWAPDPAYRQPLLL